MNQDLVGTILHLLFGGKLILRILDLYLDRIV